MRLLRAVRLDDSDQRALADEGAAEDGEWLILGGHTVCDLAQGHRALRCHCDTTFVVAGSLRRCTIAEVAEIDALAYERVMALLARHFLEALEAPSAKAAEAAAQEECA